MPGRLEHKCIVRLHTQGGDGHSGGDSIMDIMVYNGCVVESP